MEPWKASLCMTASLVVSYLLTGLWIAAMDLSGRWARYDLRYSKAFAEHIRCWVGTYAGGRRTWRTYACHARSHMFDLLFLLPIGLYGCCWATADVEKAAPAIQCIWVALALLLQMCYLMAAHCILHTPFLYRHVHRYHHASIDEVHALAAWADSPFEYIGMELASYVVVMLAFPSIHPYSWMAVFVLEGHHSAISHCGFSVNWWVDGTYHFVHHIRYKYNLAELEILDRMCGTNWE